MSEQDQHLKVQQLERDIAGLVAAIERGRTVNLLAQAALVVAGIVILAITIGAIGFDPAAIIGALVALGIGSAFLAWSRHTQGLRASILKGIAADKDALAKLADESDP